MSVMTILVLPYGGGTYTIPANTRVVGIKLNPDGSIAERKTWEPRPTQSSAAYDAMVDLSQLGIRGNPFIRATNGYFAGYYLSSAGLVLNPNDPPEGDCTELEKALETAKQNNVRLADQIREQEERIDTMKAKTAAFNADIADE